MLKVTLAGLLAVGLGIPPAAALHLTLVDSSPRENATVAEAPKEVVLKFNEALDPERRAISLRGPSGPVSMGPIRSTDTLSFAASITGTLEPGTYRVSWMAGSPDHPTIRGRYAFTVAAP